MKCPHCESENTQKTGLVKFSNPPCIEYICFDCNQKFDVCDTLEKQSSLIKHQPDLKGCFNCANYISNEDMTIFICKVFNAKTIYTDVCNSWELIKEQ